MRIYFAGNFPQMVSPESEKTIALTVLNRHGFYGRLISYYYKEPWSANVIKALTEVCNEAENLSERSTHRRRR